MIAAAGRRPEFPWDSVMAAGFGLLRLSPATFWAMTPREIERAMSVLPRAGEAPAKSQLKTLMTMFPDIPEAGSG